MGVGQCFIQVPLSCSRCTGRADLSVAGCDPNDTCSFGGPGDGNGLPEPGEDVSMEVSVQNLGSLDATNVTATVTTTTAGVTIGQPSTSFGTIPALGFVMGNPPIEYTLDLSMACDTEIVFDVDIQSTEGGFPDQCSMRVLSLGVQVHQRLDQPLGVPCVYRRVRDNDHQIHGYRLDTRGRARHL